jgi:hypothetical protein
MAMDMFVNCSLLIGIKAVNSFYALSTQKDLPFLQSIHVQE